MPFMLDAARLITSSLTLDNIPINSCSSYSLVNDAM